MKPNERQLIIMDILHQEGKISVKELVTLFAISAETIRRDLNALSRAGKLQKIHGGGILPRLIGEGPFQQRLSENVAAKRDIAKRAAALILPGDTLFIDTGSTTLSFAEELVQIDELTIITNSCDIAKITGSNPTSRVFLLGGAYHADNHETTGPLAIEQISKFQANTCVLTIGGIHSEAGLTDYNIDEALIAQAMIKQSEKVIILADSTKLNKIAAFKVASLAEIDTLVCEIEPDADLKQSLTKHHKNWTNND